MLGYVDTARTAEALRDRVGCAPTTYGYLDEHGFLYIVDRKRDMVVSSGSTSSRGRWRTCCWATRAVARAAVIGVPPPVGRGGARRWWFSSRTRRRVRTN